MASKRNPDRRWYIKHYENGQFWNVKHGWVGEYSLASLFTDDEREAYENSNGRNASFMDGAWRVWRAPKPKPPGPLKSGDTLWVMTYNTHTAVGSVSHVSNGDKLYTSEEACQHDIDTMRGWIGMGDRSKYRPTPLVLA